MANLKSIEQMYQHWLILNKYSLKNTPETQIKVMRYAFFSGVASHGVEIAEASNYSADIMFKQMDGWQKEIMVFLEEYQDDYDLQKEKEESRSSYKKLLKKAEAYDELDDAVAEIYDNPNEEVNLYSIGEMVASKFGYLD